MSVKAHFKRGKIGGCQRGGEAHLHRYLAGFDFRYNRRTALKICDAERAEDLLRMARDKRLTYRRIGDASVRLSRRAAAFCAGQETLTALRGASPLLAGFLFVRCTSWTHLQGVPLLRIGVISHAEQHRSQCADPESSRGWKPPGTIREPTFLRLLKSASTSSL